MTEITLTNALILCAPDEEQSHQRKDVFIKGGLIAELLDAGTSAPSGDVIDMSGCLVTPGLINCHHHSHEHYHKGRYDRVPLELWMNYVRPLKPIPVTARQVYVRTLIGAIQALRSGTTTIVDDLNASPVLQPEMVEAALQAYRDIGIRAMVGITLFDKPFFRALPFVSDEFPPELLAKLDGVKATPALEILDFVKGLAKTHHPESDRVSAILAPSAPQRCTDDFVRTVRNVADDMDLPVIMHVHETRLQAVTDDIQLLSDTGTSVQHNPNSNLKLGSGLMPMRAFLDAGVNVSLGTDGCGSIETVDMLRAVASTALVHKLRGDDHTRWVDAGDAWHAGTLGGAKALGFEGKMGLVAPGMRADVTCYKLVSSAFTPLNNPLRQLVYGETGADLDTIIIDGRVVMRYGKLSGIDEDSILSEAQEAHAELEPFISAAEEQTAEMAPAYARIYARCQALAIDPAVLPARFPDLK